MKQPIRKLDPAPQRLPARPVRHVVAAFLLRGDETQPEILVCQRRPDQPMSLKWEFPGGKIEPGETPEQALARELNEELGISATIGRHVITVHHTYRNGGAIEIQFFLIESFTGELENRIFRDMRWSSLAELPSLDFLAADLTLVRELADGKLL